MNANTAAAFVAVQADLRAIAKDATNPHFKNRYASLDAIVESVRPILAARGFAIMQGANAVRDGAAIEVWTDLIHLSGESIRSSVYIPLAKQDAQGAGGALTYGRRYGLSAALCLATDEDDDGNAASRPAAVRRAPRAEDGPPASSAPALSKWAGEAGDRPMPFGNTKGKPLSEHSTEHLNKIMKWCREKDAVHYAELIKDIGKHLTDRALHVE